MAQTRTARQRDLIGYAYERLRRLIVEGRLAPGTRIVESDIAERLEVSRTPVRSALQRLQHEGYITSVDGGRQARLSVASLTEEDGRELFWIVGELEGMAAYLAAERPPAERASIARALRSINERLRSESAAPHPDAHTIFDLHTDFHQRYIDAAAGPRLLALHESVKPQAERYRRVYSSVLGGDIGASLAEHEQIIAEIDAGNAEAAAAAARENWRNAAERLGRIIRIIGEHGAW
jgi:DNA-binding GntR family transcriptional regulator